ncbi:MAG: hypothetical protein KBT02_05305 [Treponema sp.]|nr:hypothetical protein [Candidatus Treponema caballi]
MKHFDRIKPDRTFMIQVKTRFSELKDEFASIKAGPPGSLRIHGGRYYHALNGKRRYLRKSDFELTKALAQKAYDRVVAARIKAELALLTPLIALNENYPISSLWTHLKPARKVLVEPVTLSDAAYAEKWSAVKYNRKSFKNGDQILKTTGGLRMRSKSELLIAGLLDECGIPFRYEYPLTVATTGGNKQFHPDFYCLEPETRTEFVWEHLGLMDDGNYRIRNEEKLELFSFSGTFLDRPLLITFEEKERPLDPEKVREKLAFFVATLKARVWS